MAAYRQVYDSRHLQADYQEPGSATEPYVRQSSIGYLYFFTSDYLRYPRKKTICNALFHPTWKCTTLICEVPSIFIWLKVCIVLAFSVLAKCAVSYLRFPYLRFPVLAFSAPPTTHQLIRALYWSAGASSCLTDLLLGATRSYLTVLWMH